MAKDKITKQPKKLNQQARLESLNRWNVGLGIVLFQQIILLLILSRNYSLPVTTNHLAVDSLASQTGEKVIYAPATHHLFDINLIYLTTAILLVGVLAHSLMAGLYRKQYEADLKKGINKIRWLTHILGGGLILITIALLNGIYDFSTLLSIFAFAEIFGLFGLLVESRKELRRHPRIVGKISFLSFIMPWLITGFYLFGTQMFGDRSLPAHIYVLDGTIFVLFLLKALNSLLHHHKYKNWQDYLFMEKVYLILSFATKTALVWQVFFAVLNP